MKTYTLQEHQEITNCPKHPKQILKPDGQIWYCPKCNQNTNRRYMNKVLRELCGTSAHAARADMGL